MEKSQLLFQNFLVTSFDYKMLNYNVEESQLDFDFKVMFSRSKERFTINADLSIVDEENNVVIELSSVGLFSFDFKDETYFDNFVSLNGPAIIFPYIRGFISNFTSLSGLSTIILPTLNLSGYKQDILDNLIDLDGEEEE